MEKVEKISLNGEWKLSDEERSLNIPVEVPGSVFEALIKDNVIDDPFYGLREHVDSKKFDFIASENFFSLEPDDTIFR